jgi:hypothetical protein
MTFNEECRFLDLTKMKTEVIKHRTIKGKEKIIRRKYPCLSEENKLDWIYECPDDCPYFSPKSEG